MVELMGSTRDGIGGDEEKGSLSSDGVGGKYSRIVIIPNWEIRETSRLRYAGIVTRPQRSGRKVSQGHSNLDGIGITRYVVNITSYWLNVAC